MMMIKNSYSHEFKREVQMFGRGEFIPYNREHFYIAGLFPHETSVAMREQPGIACAQNVYFRDDWAEETRADVAQLFHEYLAEGGNNIAAAYAAVAHLPRDLTAPTGDVSC
jgi:hypothetical protein